MLSNMNAEHLRRLHRRRPFRPFRLRLAGGSEVPVTHPENLTVSSDGSVAFVSIPGDVVEILDLPLTAAIGFRRRRRHS